MFNKNNKIKNLILSGLDILPSILVKFLFNVKLIFPYNLSLVSILLFAFSPILFPSLNKVEAFEILISSEASDFLKSSEVSTASQEGNTLPLISPIRTKFDLYKQKAIDLILSHSIVHPECILLSSLPQLQDAQFYFVAFPEQLFDMKTGKVITNLASAYVADNHVFIRTNWNWTESEAVTMLIHESLHLSNICGDDYPGKAKKSPCTLFSLKMKDSIDITNALKDHLKSFDSLVVIK